MVPMPKRYRKDQRDRAVRMVLHRLDEYPSLYAACEAISPKLGVGFEVATTVGLHAQINSGQRSGPTSDELAEIKTLKIRSAIWKKEVRFFVRHRKLKRSFTK